MQPQVCSRCGKLMPSSASFCRRCGMALIGEVRPAAPARVPAASAPGRREGGAPRKGVGSVFIVLFILFVLFKLLSFNSTRGSRPQPSPPAYFYSGGGAPSLGVNPAPSPPTVRIPQAPNVLTPPMPTIPSAPAPGIRRGTSPYGAMPLEPYTPPRPGQPASSPPGSSSGRGR